MSSGLLRHRHHTILLNPLIQRPDIEPQSAPQLDVGDTPLADHLVQRMHGEAGVLSRLFYGQQLMFPDDLTHASLSPSLVFICPPKWVLTCHHMLDESLRLLSAL